MKRWLQFWKDQRGVAAVEFALIAPGMVVLLFGVIEVNELNIASTRTMNAAIAMADVTSREATITNAEMNGVLDASANVVFPKGGTAVRLRITSVEMTTATQGKAIWSDARGLGAYAAGAAVVLPSTVDGPCAGPSVILAEAEYDFRSPAGLVLGSSAWPMKRAVVMCPRVGQYVTRDTTT